MLSRLYHIIGDYLYALYRHAFFWAAVPRHYLGYVAPDKHPIILLPGLYESWQMLRSVANQLSHLGHPVYVLDQLNYNTAPIPALSHQVGEFLTAHNLTDVILIAHSKGGLVGKYLLAFDNGSGRVHKLIAIATPFSGSTIGRRLPLKAVRELLPESEIIQTLAGDSTVNHQIVSIYGSFDNHIWHQRLGYLEGAKNIQIDAKGHHKITADGRVIAAILSEVA